MKQVETSFSEKKNETNFKAMEKLTVTLAGQGPDVASRLKAVSYAPFALKAYLDFHLPNFLRDKVKTKVLDFKWDISAQAMTSHILVGEPDIVGFSVYLWNYKQILECARNLKALKKDIIIILGGPQVSPIAEAVMAENSCVDIISFAHSSGEITLLDIVETIFHKGDLNTVNGICYRDARGKIIKTSPDVRPLDYKTTQSPYAKVNGVFDENIEYMAIVEASRGCPSDCGYCFWSHGKCNIEYFPLTRVLRDIEAVYNNPKVKCVYFTDSNLLSNIERAKIIIKHIIKQKSQAKTDSEMNFVYFEKSSAKLMASFSNFRFLIAVQSTNPNALKHISRVRPSPEIFEKKLRQLKQWIPGVKCHVDIMLGLPGDDFDGFMRTLDFVLSLEPFYIVLNYPVYLLPGSRFFENRETWNLRYTSTPPFSIIETPTFPRGDIERALKITVWIQILTFYYPAVARFFYDIASSDGVRLQRLLRWIRTVERKMDLFGPYGNLTDRAATSLTKWNTLKKDLLETASTAKSAHVIYSSVRDAEKPFVNSAFGMTIQLGCDIFEYMAQHKMDAIEFNSFELLPPDIIGKNDAGVIKDLFSVYKR